MLDDKNSQNRWLMRTLFVVFVVLAVLIIERLQYTAYQTDRVERINAAKLQLQSVSARFEGLITNEILRATSLSNYIVVSPAVSPDHLQAMGREMIRQSNILQTVAVAPDDVVSTVVPVDGNEKVLDLRLRDISDQWPSVLTSRINQAAVLNGPVNLVEGGRGLILRIPVFRDPPSNDLYWGNISLVIDWMTLLERAGISELPDSYQIAIFSDEYGVNPSEPIFGALTDEPQATQTIYFPLNHWVIQGAEVPHLTAWDIWKRHAQIRLLAYPMLFVLCVAFWVIFKLYRTANLHSLQDELTKLPNRRYLMYTLKQLAEHSAKTQSVFTILNIDLNKFKQINDTYGHGAGDTVLIEAAKRLKSGLRGTDIVARVGGDEFLVLIPRVGNNGEIEVITQNLKTRIESEPVEVMGTDKQTYLVHMSCSIGFAVYEQRQQDLDSLLKRADEKMYEVKQAEALG